LYRLETKLIRDRLSSGPGAKITGFAMRLLAQFARLSNNHSLLLRLPRSLCLSIRSPALEEERSNADSKTALWPLVACCRTLRPALSSHRPAGIDRSDPGCAGGQGITRERQHQSFQRAIAAHRESPPT